MKSANQACQISPKSKGVQRPQIRATYGHEFITCKRYKNDLNYKPSKMCNKIKLHCA